MKFIALFCELNTAKAFNGESHYRNSIKVQANLLDPLTQLEHSLKAILLTQLFLFRSLVYLKFITITLPHKTQ